MTFTRLLTVSAVASVMFASPVMAADTSMNPEQTKQVEQVIHDYLVSHPEVLVEASQVLQQRQQQTMQKEAQSAISQNADGLLNGKLAVAGNPKGNVTVVEFFDYQCIHCKKMKPVISELIQKDSNVRVVYKEFPIFGKSSELASRAALAAAIQGKYIPFHDALLQLDKHLDKALILSTAKTVGLNVSKLETDMDSKAVSDELEANRKLAEKMHLMGTPAFVVLATPGGVLKAGTEPAFIPGGTTFDALQSLVKKAAGQ